jgi:ABC-type sugar transport system ATPase subunit
VTEPRLEVRDVVKAYGPTLALRGVSLTVQPGEIHGLCGQNGAGKSTLVKVLSGSIRPDSGEVRLDGRPVSVSTPRHAQEAGVAVVDQELTVVPALSLRENLLMGRSGRPFLVHRDADRTEARELLARVGLGDLDPDGPCDQLSMAQCQLLEIGRLLGRDAKLLILDEPTASLNRADSLLVFSALRELARSGHSVLYVSHRLDEVVDLCDRVTVLRDGARVADRASEELDQDSLIDLITGEQRSLEQTPGEAAAAQTLVAEDEGVQCVRLHVAVPDRVEPVDIEVTRGRVVGIAGQVGSGASELLRALVGLEPGAQASVEIGNRALRPRSAADAVRNGVAYVSNDRKGEGVFLTRSVGHNLLATRLHRMSGRGIVRRRAVRSASDALIERLGVKTRSGETRVADLSGGNQQKVLVGRCLDRPDVTLLLLDEPTRGVDVRGRADIHNLLKAASRQGLAVVFISGEPEEILELADDVLCMSHGEVVCRRPAAEMDSRSLLAETTRAVGSAGAR